MRKLIRKGRKGFTLIELMIVVAIIGILAAIAIPNFLRFQLKAKTSEGKVNIAAIRTAETSYHAEFGDYVSAAAEPGTVPGSSKAAFDDTAAGFSTLGWAPEGEVYFSYQIDLSSDNVGYTVSGEADIDGDADHQGWAYAKPDGSDALTDGNGECTGLAITPNTVAPCDSTFGQSVF